MYGHYYADKVIVFHAFNDAGAFAVFDVQCHNFVSEQIQGVHEVPGVKGSFYLFARETNHELLF